MNILARKYPSKMVQYSKPTFGYQVSNETYSDNLGFWFREQSGKNHGAIFLKHFKSLHHCFQKQKAPIVGFTLIWNLTSKGPFWVLNHFWGIFSGRDIWETTPNFWSIINFLFKFTNIQKIKDKKQTEIMKILWCVQGRWCIIIKWTNHIDNMKYCSLTNSFFFKSYHQ